MNLKRDHVVQADVGQPGERPLYVATQYRLTQSLERAARFTDIGAILAVRAMPNYLKPKAVKVNE